MPRPATGSLDIRPRKDGQTTYAARVPHKGRQERVTFGTDAQGWNEQRAQNELDRIMNEVRRGVWEPLGRRPDRPAPSPTADVADTLCFLAGRDPRYVMGQIGHADPRMTLAVYAQVVSRRSVDGDLVWRLMAFPDEQEMTDAGTNVHAQG